MKKGIWLNENEFYEINDFRISFEEKDYLLKRLKIIISFLGFFITAFNIGYLLTIEAPIFSSLRWFSIWFMGSSLYSLYLLVISIILHLFSLSNSRALNYFYLREEIEKVYLEVAFSLLFSILSFCCLPITIKIFDYFNILSSDIPTVWISTILLGLLVFWKDIKKLVKKRFLNKIKNKTINKTIKKVHKYFFVSMRYVLLYLLFLNIAASFHQYMLFEKLSIMGVCIL